MELGCGETYSISVVRGADNDSNKITKGMMKTISLLIFIAIVFMSCIQNALFTARDKRLPEQKYGDIGNEIKFSHHAILDTDGKYHLYWLPETNSITFEVQVSEHRQDSRCI